MKKSITNTTRDRELVSIDSQWTKCAQNNYVILYKIQRVVSKTLTQDNHDHNERDYD